MRRPPVRQILLLASCELRGGLRGFGVFLACLFLGVFAIGGVGSFAASVRHALLTDARALLGGDLEVRLTHRGLTPAQADWLRAAGRVSAVVELRGMPLAADTGTRILVEIKAVDEAYPLYGAVTVAPPMSLANALMRDDDGCFGALVEHALLERMGVSSGSVLELGASRLRIRGVLTREPDRTLSVFTFGPRLLISDKALAATGLLHPGSLAVYAFRLRLPEHGPLAATVKEDLQDEFPTAGWRLRTWQEAQPRVSDFIDRMTGNLTLVGLCTLLVGGVGVNGAVRGYLLGKVPHIAAMKCIGASRGMIFGGYLLQVLVLGSIGALGGIMASAAVPWIVQGIAGPVLPVQTGIYAGPLLIAGIFGLLVALLFSFNALGSACRVPPSALFRRYAEPLHPHPSGVMGAVLVLLAIALAALAVFTSTDRRLALWFVTGATVCFGCFRWLSVAGVQGARRIPRPPQMSLRLALAAIQRRGSPAAGIVFSLGLWMTALVIVAQVQANLSRRVSENIPADAPAFFAMDLQDDQIPVFEALLAEIPGVTRSERFPTLRGRITAIKGIPSEEAEIDPTVNWAVHGDRFLSCAAHRPAGANVVAGHWWPPDYTGPPQLSLTADVAAGFGVVVGDAITVNVLGREITTRIANLRHVDWTSLNLNFVMILDPAALAGAPQTHLASIHADPGAEDAVFHAVSGRLPNVTLIGTRETLENVSRMLRRIGAAFKGMASVASITGFLVLAGALSADQRRRIHDAVIFKICGATRRDLICAFAVEFLLLGGIASLISLGVGSLAAWGITQGLMNTAFRLAPVAALQVLLPGLAAVLLLGLAGTWRALGGSPAACLRRF